MVVVRRDHSLVLMKHGHGSTPRLINRTYRHRCATVQPCNGTQRCPLAILIQKWKADAGRISSSTRRILYTNRLHAFDPFLKIEVESITPSTVDAFFAHLRSPAMKVRYTKSRTSFDKEMELFKNLLERWYRKT